MRRSSRAAPRLGARQWLKIAIAAAGVILAGWLVVRTSLANLFVRENLAIAAMVAPGDPRIPLARATDELLVGGGRVRPATKRGAFEALDSVPLAGEPFLLAAIDALVVKDVERGHALLLEARRRKPRYPLTRLLLLDRFLRTGQIDEAAGEMAAVRGLAPATNDVLVAELARLAQDRKTGGAVLAALRRTPSFRDPVLEKLATNNADPDLILRLARDVPKAPGSSGPAAWEGKLLTSLVERNQVPRAYQLWRTFSASKAPEAKAGIYDERFQGLPGTAPFNWQFPPSTAGLAERTNERLMQVEYYGRDDAELASQLLMQPPGTYRLSVRVEGDSEGEGSMLRWKIACHPNKTEILDLVLKKITYTPRVVAANFTVPAAGCSAQWLRLVGSAGEFPKAQHLTVSGIRLEAAR